MLLDKIVSNKEWLDQRVWNYGNFEAAIVHFEDASEACRCQ